MSNPNSPTAVIVELRRAWLASGVTLASLGQSMGVRSPQAVAQLLNGSRDVRLSTLLRLADALGYDVTLSKRDPS